MPTMPPTYVEQAAETWSIRTSPRHVRIEPRAEAALVLLRRVDDPISQRCDQRLKPAGTLQRSLGYLIVVVIVMTRQLDPIALDPGKHRLASHSRPPWLGEIRIGIAHGGERAHLVAAVPTPRKWLRHIGRQQLNLDAELA